MLRSKYLSLLAGIFYFLRQAEAGQVLERKPHLLILFVALDGIISTCQIVCSLLFSLVVLCLYFIYFSPVQAVTNFCGTRKSSPVLFWPLQLYLLHRLNVFRTCQNLLTRDFSENWTGVSKIAEKSNPPSALWVPHFCLSKLGNKTGNSDAIRDNSDPL